MYRISQVFFIAAVLLGALSLVSAQASATQCWRPIHADMIPATATSCTDDSECTVVLVAECCSTRPVAVNVDSAPCVERRGPGAGCEMVCEAAEVLPVYTADCVSSICQLVAPSPEPEAEPTTDPPPTP